VKAAERVLPQASGLRGGGQAVQPEEVRLDVQVGVLGFGDEQRGSRQIDVGLRPLDRDGELAEWLVGANTRTSRRRRAPA